MRRRLRRLPTRALVSQALTVGLALWSCYTGVEVAIRPCAPDAPALPIALVGLAAMAVLCYLLTMHVDPGRVPQTYAPDDGRRLLAPRCEPCGVFKPPRTHHCRICDRCVLKMDHHCPWVNNCVGFANYKFYLLLLLYAAAALSLLLAVLGARALSVLDAGYCPGAAPLSGAALAAAALNALVAVAVLGCVLWLGGWHVYLVAHNATTIEYYQGLRARGSAAGGGGGAAGGGGDPAAPGEGAAAGTGDAAWRAPPSTAYVYNAGLLANVRGALGPFALLWLLPTPAPADGGTRFKRVSDDAAAADDDTAHLLEAELPTPQPTRRRFPGASP